MHARLAPPAEFLVGLNEVPHHRSRHLFWIEFLMRDFAGVLDVRVDLLFEESSDCDREVAQSQPFTFDIGFHFGCSLPQFR